MNTIILGNIIALFGSIVMVMIGFLKKKEKIIIAQCIQCGFIGLANLVLGGISGFVTNCFTILRNCISFKIEFTKKIKIIFILIQFLLVILLKQVQWINLLPVLSTSIFTWYMDCKDPIVFKIVVIVTLLMWLVYDLSVLNYVAVFFDTLTTITNTITLYKMKKGAAL